MMPCFVTLSILFLTSVQAQFALFPLPPQCMSIYNQGSTNPYELTSMAGIYQKFCSVKESISSCLDANKANAETTNDHLGWAYSVAFERTDFDAKARRMCEALPNVASDLECLTSHQDRCLGGLDSTFMYFHDQYKRTNAPHNASREVCGILSKKIQCYRSTLTSCSDSAKAFIADYYGLFCNSDFSDLEFVSFGSSSSGSSDSSSRSGGSVLPEWTKTSVFMTCAQEIYSDIIKDFQNHVAKTQDASMEAAITLIENMCLKTDTYSKCVVERSKTTSSKLDKILLEFMNVNNLKKVFDMKCSLIDDIRDISKTKACFNSLPKQGSSCIAIYMPEVLNTSSLMGGLAGGIMSQDFDISALKNSICRGLMGLADCSYIPLSRCSKNYAQKVIEMVNVMMSDSCRALSNQGVPAVATQPMASVFMQCGISIYSSMTKAFKKDPTKPMTKPMTTQDMSVIIDQSIDVTCRNAEWYLSCVNDRLSRSPNYIDKFFRELIDISNEAVRKYVVSTVCSRNLPDIKSSMNCMVSKVVPKQLQKEQQQQGQVYAERPQPEIFKCVAKTNLSRWEVLTNSAKMLTDGPSIRSEFCGPIDSMIKCAQTYFGTCNENVAPLLNSIPRALLRTDCGGVKPDISDAVTYTLRSTWTKLSVTSMTIALFLLTKL